MRVSCSKNFLKNSSGKPSGPVICHFVVIWWLLWSLPSETGPPKYFLCSVGILWMSSPEQKVCHAEGLLVVLNYSVGSKRKWQLHQSYSVFGVSSVMLACSYTGLLENIRFITVFINQASRLVQFLCLAGWKKVELCNSIFFLNNSGVGGRAQPLSRSEIDISSSVCCIFCTFLICAVWEMIFPRK